MSLKAAHGETSGTLWMNVWGSAGTWTTTPEAQEGKTCHFLRERSSQCEHGTVRISIHWWGSECLCVRCMRHELVTRNTHTHTHTHTHTYTYCTVYILHYSNSSQLCCSVSTIICCAFAFVGLFEYIITVWYYYDQIILPSTSCSLLFVP